MSEPPFVTLSTGGMQQTPSTGSSSGTSSSPEPSPASSVSSITHDTSRTKYHMDELATFAARLENAAKAIFPSTGKSRYDDVRVLLLRWEEDPMGIQVELGDLAEAFALSYGFETETWLIPSQKSHIALMAKALQMVNEFGQAGNLLIVYYGGHGLMNDSRQTLWTCNENVKYAFVQCGKFSTIESMGTTVRETIAACGFETSAPQPGRFSFTNTLIAVLKEWRSRPSFTAAMLHCEVLNRLRHEKPERYRDIEKAECRKSPIHITSTNDPKARSIEICPRIPVNKSDCFDASKPQDFKGRGAAYSKMDFGANIDIQPSLSPTSSAQAATDSEIDDLYQRDSLTKVYKNGTTALPQVLITLALEEEQLLDFEQCRRWLQDFPALAKYAKVQGVYRSNSTLMILSLPVVVWDWIPDDPACSFIGYVHSQNLLKDVCGSTAIGAIKTTRLSGLTEVSAGLKPLESHFGGLPLGSIPKLCETVTDHVGKDLGLRDVKPIASGGGSFGTNMPSQILDEHVSKSGQKRVASVLDEPLADRGMHDKKPRIPRPFSEERKEHFACPFRKHDPKKYSLASWTKCALGNYASVACVKEHLYRYHRAYQCIRCQRIFQSEELLNHHVRGITECELRVTSTVDGITSDLERMLRRRTRKIIEQTQSERWREIYRLLFPNEDIPSPYYEPIVENSQSTPDSKELQEFAEYARVALPRIVRAALEAVVANGSLSLGEPLQAQMRAIIQESQMRLWNQYLQGKYDLPDDTQNTSSFLPSMNNSMQGRSTVTEHPLISSVNHHATPGVQLTKPLRFIQSAPSDSGYASNPSVFGDPQSSTMKRRDSNTTVVTEYQIQESIKRFELAVSELSDVNLLQCFSECISDDQNIPGRSYEEVMEWVSDEFLLHTLSAPELDGNDFEEESRNISVEAILESNCSPPTNKPGEEEGSAS